MFEYLMYISYDLSNLSPQSRNFHSSFIFSLYRSLDSAGRFNSI